MKYVLVYKGLTDYVHVDDSTGPMSTGGYPEKVHGKDAIWRATKFDTAEDALRYADMFPEISNIAYPVELTIMGSGVMAGPKPPGKHRLGY